MDQNDRHGYFPNEKDMHYFYVPVSLLVLLFYKNYIILASSVHVFAMGMNLICDFILVSPVGLGIVR